MPSTWNRVAVAGCLLCLALSTACTGATSPSARSTPIAKASSLSASTNRPSPSPTPTPTVWTKNQGAAQYLRIVKPSNMLLNQWGALPTQGDYRTYVALAKKIRDAEDIFARALLAGKWDPETRPLVTTLARDMLRDRIYWATVANSTTDGEESAAANDPGMISSGTTSSADATSVRISLGLPSN